MSAFVARAADGGKLHIANRKTRSLLALGTPDVDRLSWCGHVEDPERAESIDEGDEWCSHCVREWQRVNGSHPAEVIEGEVCGTGGGTDE